MRYCVIGMCVAALSSMVMAEMVTNGGFEDTSSLSGRTWEGSYPKWYAIPTGWSSVADVNANYYTDDAGEAGWKTKPTTSTNPNSWARQYEGTYSAQFFECRWNALMGSSGGSFYQTITVEKGKEYAVSAATWAYDSRSTDPDTGAAFYTDVSVIDGAPTIVDRVMQPGTVLWNQTTNAWSGGSTWQEVSGTFTATSNQVTIVLYSSGADNAYFDAVSMTEVPEPSTMTLLGLGALVASKKKMMPRH